ncbi:hypothetical protein DUI87_06434 [Hirundo rustica rustica]|uniref:UBA domain-containing protein n=1 Tax=Hirundo rustica rustica TaxID=333673 RepID=A0A3M0KT77_HIRRU|nr:hypothetical protein DUI87_06434 [Hirundo rustica rustica]
MQISATQPTQPQKQVVQATAEQIRLAQMIYDKNDADFEDKVKQLMEVTGKNQDECIVALHDCNGDVNRAINILLEGSSDTTSWETVGGKKKSLGKEGSENKENREKRGDREVSRGRGSSNRRGRGGSRGREFRAEENGVDNNQGDKPSDRGKRGRGRGEMVSLLSGLPSAFGSQSEEGQASLEAFCNEKEFGMEELMRTVKKECCGVLGIGRGRGRGAGRFSAQGMGTFNPADYTESSATDGFGTKSEIWETGQNDADDGTGAWKNSIEEWTAEDWNEDLSETKVFTSSSVPAENHVTPGQSIDLVTLLQKPVTSTQETEGNSFESPQQQTFGQALVFTNSQHSTQMTSGTGSSNAVNSYSPQSLPEPSPVLSQLTQRQQQQMQVVPVPSPGLESSSSQAKLREPSPVDTSTAVSKILQLPSISMDNQAVTVQQTQQKQIKPPKRRITPASKIPASAVEMPGSADMTGLNVQFGALEFGSEPTLPEFGSASSSENTSQATNNSLYSKSVNDSLNTSLPVSNTVQDSTYTTSAISSSSLTCSSQSTSPVTTSSYDQTSVHSRIAYQSSMALSEPTPVAVTNGHSGVRTQATLDSKAPPNLPQGVPPLLHNQYIVGPGGLLPAYPVSSFIVSVFDFLALGASGPSRPATVYAKAFLVAHVRPGIPVPNAKEHLNYVQ